MQNKQYCKIETEIDTIFVYLFIYLIFFTIFEEKLLGINGVTYSSEF